MEKKSLQIVVHILAGYERGSWLCPALFMSFFRFMQEAIDRGHEVQFWMHTLTPIAYARNKAVQVTLDETPQCDFVLFLDNDQSIPENFIELIERAYQSPEVNVVCGCTWMRAENRMAGFSPDWPLVNNSITGSQYVESLPMAAGFTEIDWGGSGVLLVKRTVFEQLPRPWFKFMIEDELQKVRLSEDLFFCRLAKEHNFKIHTHTGYPASHFKTVDLHSYQQNLESARMIVTMKNLRSRTLKADDAPAEPFTLLESLGIKPVPPNQKGKQ